MRLSPRAMRKMFQPTLDHIKQLIGNVLNEPSLKGNSRPLSQRINNVQQELRQGGSCPDPDIHRVQKKVIYLFLPYISHSFWTNFTKLSVNIRK